MESEVNPTENKACSTPPKVSIIIPVYKTEAFLSRCLDSCLAQTDPAWEAVCVDDGSPDRCPEILDAYAAKDSRFVVIHQPNSGVSSARNQALKAATAPYIIMLDSDDELEPQAVAVYAAADASPEADAVFAAAYRQYDDGSTMGILPIKDSFPQRGCVPITGEFLYSVSSFVCAKMLKRDIIRRYELSYSTSIAMCEDFHFNMLYLSHCRSVKIIDDSLYVYYMHGASTSNAYRTGQAALSSYIGHVGVMADIARRILQNSEKSAGDSDGVGVPGPRGKERAVWLNVLYRKNLHTMMTPLLIASRMPLKARCRVYAAALKAFFYLFVRVSPITWVKCFVEDVQLYLCHGMRQPCHFDDRSRCTPPTNMQS